VAEALSTVAFSAYNLLTLTGPSSVEDLAAAFPYPMSGPRLREALVALVDRRYVKCTQIVEASPLFDVLDRKRRRVVGRDRSDARVTEDGDILGGWEKWTVQCAQRGLISIEAAIAETPALPLEVSP